MARGTVCVVALLVLAGKAEGQDTCATTNGFRYLERSEQGKAKEKPREWPANAKVTYGVDIDSRIEIAVDQACLLEYLHLQNGAAPPDTVARSLQRRIASLQQSVATIPEALRELDTAFVTFQRNTAADSMATRGAISRAMAAVNRTLDPLDAAIRIRLQSQPPGRDSADAQALADTILDPVTREGGPSLYNWDALRALLASEIKLTQAAVNSVLDAEGYQIEIRAHLLDRKGGQFPIALRGYNEVATGPDRPFERFQTVLPPDQAELYRQAQSLEKTVAEAKSLGEAFERSLELEFSAARAALEDLFGDAANAASRLEKDVRRLQRWGDRQTVQTWLTKVARQLDATPEGAVVRTALDSAGADLEDAREDIAALRQFASLKDELRDVGADVAMTRILSRVQTLQLTVINSGESPLRGLRPQVWQARVKRVQKFFQSLEGLPKATAAQLERDTEGPVTDLRALMGTLEAVVTELQEAAPQAIAVLGQLAGLPIARTGANLPEPTGQRRLSIGSEIGTEIVLRTIQATRDEQDEVLVGYRFFRRDQPVAGAWEDRLRLQAYGWRSRVVAGMAFAVREHTRAWQPGAAVSWIVTRRSWPRLDETGTGDPAGLGRIGLGFSTINLRFEGESGIQLGVGPTLSLLGERLLLGAGWNLQAEEDQLFGFFLLRLFTVSSGASAGG
jgi:hypothetical protein